MPTDTSDGIRCNSDVRPNQTEWLYRENCDLRRQLADAQAACTDAVTSATFIRDCLRERDAALANVTAERDRLRDALGMQPLPPGPEKTHRP